MCAWKRRKKWWRQDERRRFPVPGMIKETQPAIRVLHLFSNSKWTGPAEPAVNLCGALRRRGIDVDFACAPEAGSGYNKVQAMARRHGMEPLGFMNLSKHRSLLKNWQDARALRRHLMTTAYDLIHCHLDNDTAIALRAASGLSLPVVRSSYEGTGFARDRRHHYFMRKCDAVIEPSHRARQEDDSYFRVGSENCMLPTPRLTRNGSIPGGPSRLRRKLGIRRTPSYSHCGAHSGPPCEDLFWPLRISCGVGRPGLVIIGRGSCRKKSRFARESAGLKNACISPAILTATTMWAPWRRWMRASSSLPRTTAPAALSANDVHEHTHDNFRPRYARRNRDP